MNKFKSRFHQFGDRTWWLILSVGVLLFLGVGDLEGRNFPTSEPAKLRSVVAVQNYELGQIELPLVMVWGQSKRLRTSCNFERVEWRIGRRSGRNAPLFTFVGPSQVRPDGETFDFGPWAIIGSPALDISENSFADVLHRCAFVVFGHRINFPWLTRSPFYDPPMAADLTEAPRD